MMHLDNPILPHLASDLERLRANIPKTHDFFEEMARKNSNVEVRQIKQGLLHFFMTRTDQYVVVIQFLASQMGERPLVEVRPRFQLLCRRYSRIRNAVENQPRD
jgi:hypothetical protein